MATKLIESTWADFSSRFAKNQSLPFGCELRLYSPDRRKKRSDFVIKRRQINSKALIKVDNKETVSVLLDMARKCLSTDLEARKLKLELYSPSGERIDVRTSLQKVRDQPPRETEADKRRKVNCEIRIEYLKKIAQAEIVESEYLEDDPEHIVCHAYIGALIDRYGVNNVKNAAGL